MGGFSSVRDARAEIDAKRESAGGQFFNYLKFKLEDDGDSAVVRFLRPGEDETIWRWCHRVQRPNRQYPEHVPCLDQDSQGRRTGVDCPLCEREEKRSFQGWTKLIWRDAPVFGKKKVTKGDNEYERIDYDKVVGVKDQVAIWQSGITLFEELDIVDAKYKRVDSRDFEITRKGAKRSKKTTYSITPADVDGGPQPLSDDDKELIENDELDLAVFTKLMSYDEMLAWMSGQSASSYSKDEDEEERPSPVQKNAFTLAAERRAERDAARAGN